MIYAPLPVDRREESVADGWSAAHPRPSRALSVALAAQRRFGNDVLIFSMQSGCGSDGRSEQPEDPESPRRVSSSPPASNAQNDGVTESVPASSVPQENRLTDYDQLVCSCRSHSEPVSNSRVRRPRLRLNISSPGAFAQNLAVTRQTGLAQRRFPLDHSEATRNTVDHHTGGMLSAFDDVQQRALMQAEFERLENSMRRGRFSQRPRDPIYEERDRRSREHQAEGTRRAIRNRERDRARRERLRRERMSGGGWTVPDASLATGANATVSVSTAPVAPMYPQQSESSGPEGESEQERRVGASPTATPESPSRDCAQNEIEAQQRENEETESAESEDEDPPRTPLQN
ncbi:hypothetical protein E4T42_04579 [Aureobasidium subglaciale]|nr:hypothetical protein E4T42_04579 [Aureobasidium subglaciale]